MLCVGSGMLVFSPDKLQQVKKENGHVAPEPIPAKSKPTPPIAKPKAYVQLGSQLIELKTVAEERQMKKEGYVVVYK